MAVYVQTSGHEEYCNSLWSLRQRRLITSPTLYIRAVSSQEENKRKAWERRKLFSSASDDNRQMETDDETGSGDALYSFSDELFYNYKLGKGWGHY
jgi:hypothetical protein